ncbi:hypothetical protein Tco_0987962 [Tanacetum coccineum]|uniref:Uncharacterized protein n=1 Tax=Tanacetum coccineum TaxID=301880 RepID=A0ABQ5EQD2_9ASTR
MPSWTSSESRVISGRVEYFCKYDDLPSEYYKELLYGMFQKQKQSKKHMDYEQVINVLAMEKSRLEEELRVTKSKLKLYDSKANTCSKCLLQMLVAVACIKANTCSKCLLQMLVAVACIKANTCSKCLLQMLAANACCNSLLQSKYL